MKPVSLKKVSVVALACFAGTFLVNAKEPVELAKSNAADKAKSTFTQLLKKADSNKNGELSKDELEGAMESQLLSAFNEIDTNGDKSIDEDEFTSYVGKTAKI